MKKPTVEEIIQMTIAAQRLVSEREASDAYRATEKRLYAYPDIKSKIANDRERMEDIQLNGMSGKNNCVVRFQKSGVRLTPDEISEIIINDINAEIAANEYEIETIDKALGIIIKDPYKNIIRYKYFEGKNDDEIAVLISCDASTVRRNKSRLVRRLSVFLYGVAAVA